MIESEHANEMDDEMKQHKIGDMITMRKPSGVPLHTLNFDERMSNFAKQYERIIAREAMSVLLANTQFMTRTDRPRLKVTRAEKLRSWFQNRFTRTIGDDYQTLTFIKVWRFHFLIRES